MASPARSAIAAERLHIKQFPPSPQALAGALLRQCRIAVQADGLFDRTHGGFLRDRAILRRCDHQKESAWERGEQARVRIHWSPSVHAGQVVGPANGETGE